MKKFHICAYKRVYGLTTVFSEDIEAPSEKDARIEFERQHRFSWITHIKEIK